VIAERERRQLGEAAQNLLQLYEKGQHLHLLNEVEMLSKGGALPADVLGMAALSMLESERYADAASAAREALKAAPGQAWLHHALAAAEAGQGRLEGAVEAARRAVQLMPGHPGYGASLARYLRLAGQVEAAVRTARQALLPDGSHAGALCELGLALAAAGDRSGALEQFRMAQQVGGGAPEGFLHEGALHLAAGARAEARAALHGALARRPGWAEAENLLARSLAGSGGPVAAALVHALNLGRVTVVGWGMIAFLYYLLFRLLEFIWKMWPVALPVGQVLLVATLVWLLGGLVLGRAARFTFGRGWPR
jgi:tetratricopeptide (TPR) repeat protein